MSEPLEAPQITEPPTAPAETAETAAPEIDWKTKAREWEKRAKDNFAQINELKPLADQFRSLEEASKSEAQRLVESAEASKREAEDAKAEAIRYKAAATHKIGAEHFDLLGSGTEEEVSARAEKVAALLAAQAAALTPPAVPPVVPGSGRPVEQLRPGATPAGAVDEEELVYQSLFGVPK